MTAFSVEEARKHFPKDGQTFDVIVAGAGPAGLGAALAARHQGASVLVLEALNRMGGTAAFSGWMPMNRLYVDGHTRGGVHETFVRKIKSLGADASLPGKTTWVDGDGLHVHPDYLRYATLTLLEEQGAFYRLHSPVTGVEMDGKRLKAVKCGGKFGEATFYAHAFVDATGDGDVAYRAGAPVMLGREGDGAFMPVTLSFVISNADEAKLFAAIDALGAEGFQQLIQAGEADGYAVSAFYSFDRTTVPGLISVNNAGLRGVGALNASDIDDLNLAERAGLQVAMDFVRICRERRIPGLEQVCLARTGPALGIRETRRIRGDYVMDVKDCQSGVTFPDAVARRYGTIDPGGLSESQRLHGTIANGHAFPYRALLPLNVEGLLLAGRCCSQTHLGAATCKSMGNMMDLGQAAGTAAALCARRNCLPREMDAESIRSALRESGVDI